MPLILIYLIFCLFAIRFRNFGQNGLPMCFDWHANRIHVNTIDVRRWQQKNEFISMMLLSRAPCKPLRLLLTGIFSVLFKFSSVVWLTLTFAWWRAMWWCLHTAQHKLTLIGYVIFVFVLNDFDWKRPYYNSHRTEKREFMKPRCVISHLIHTHLMPFFSLFRSSSVRMCVVWVDGCVCASLSSSGMLGTFEHIHFVWLTTMSRCANKWDMSKATMITTPATQNIQFITKCGILSFSFT